MTKNILNEIKVQENLKLRNQKYFQSEVPTFIIISITKGAIIRLSSSLSLSTLSVIGNHPVLFNIMV